MSNRNYCTSCEFFTDHHYHPEEDDTCAECGHPNPPLDNARHLMLQAGFERLQELTKLAADANVALLAMLDAAQPHYADLRRIYNEFTEVKGMMRKLGCNIAPHIKADKPDEFAIRTRVCRADA